jgi:DNA-binding NtrC family response regulator
MSLSGRTIGLVEDDEIMGGSIVQRLSLEGISVKWWRSGREAAASIGLVPLQAVICDIRLPDISGEDLFRETARCADLPPFMFITGFGDIDQAVRLMRSGAADYFTKPFDLDDFLLRLNHLTAVRSPASPTLGPSPAARDLERLLRRIGKANSNVLITGETGSGKEVAARFIHSVSAAAGRPFMAVNCAAIPAEMMESELLGHERGAFTGASQRHLGYAERAGDGILFLDEIGDLRVDLQAKLLRLIEEKSFFRLGGERPVSFKGRIIAATNGDLGKLVETGRFREDLYYRLNVLPVRVPALRERRQDIPWLMDRYFSDFASGTDTPLRGLSSLAEEAALTYRWPGNIRELRNRMERAVALGIGQWIMPADLFPENGEQSHDSDGRIGSLEQARLDAERRHIVRALEATGGEIGAASKLLGVGRTTLWEKMRRLAIGGSSGSSPK